MISYQDFKNLYMNQTMVGTNPSNQGQCMGLVEKWLFINGLPFVGGNAKDFYNNAPDQYFIKLPPNTTIQQGDIFDCGPPWGLNPRFDPSKPESPTNVKYFGHIGFVDQPELGLAFMGYEQNGVLSTPNKVQIVFHQTRLGFIGFLRLKEEYQMQVFDEQARQDWNLIFFGHDEGLFHEFVGHEFKKAMYEIKNSDAFKHEHYVNGADVNYYMQAFAGHVPTNEDLQSLGIDPNAPGDKIGTQTHKQVAYALTKRDDVINRGAPATQVLQPGQYQVK